MERKKEKERDKEDRRGQKKTEGVGGGTGYIRSSYTIHAYCKMIGEKSMNSFRRISFKSYIPWSNSFWAKNPIWTLLSMFWII